jgi:DNA polymerase-3 subunit beta
MKFIIGKANLLENLIKVSKAITGKSSVQALHGVFIQVANGHILMLGSDMDLSILVQGGCEVVEPGSILVDAKMFLEIIRKLPKGEVTISTGEDDLIEISCGKSLFNVVHMNEKEYPEFPKENNGTEIIVAKDIFSKMIGQVGYAIAQDSLRPILQGILYEVKDSILRLVALDGYRIAYSSSKVDTAVDMSAVIDGRSLINISRLIDNVGSMKIYLHNNHIEFRFDNLIIYSRLLDGKYVAYEQLVPSNSELIITCNRIEIIESIERSALIAQTQDSLNPILNFKIFKSGMVDTLEIKSKSTKGKGREELAITIDKLNSDSFEIAFNGRYLLDMFKNMDSEKIVMNFNNALSPCLCSSLNDESSKFVILPVRVSK